MQIALSSAPVRNKDIPHNLAAMTAALAQAAADGADLVVFGESTLQGFDCLCWSYAADRDMALPLDSAPIRQLQDAARKYATAIAFGFIERDGDALYSSCAFIGADGRPEEMHALDADVVLWPVWCDYRADEWNSTIKHEYAEQAQKCGRRVLLINPYCADDNADDAAAGGAVDFRDGKIQAEMPAGNSGMLMVTV